MEHYGRPTALILCEIRPPRRLYPHGFCSREPETILYNLRHCSFLAMTILTCSEETVRPWAMQLLAAPPASGLLQAAAAKIAATGEWLAVLRLCQRWNVLPSLAATVAREKIALPSTQAASLQRENTLEFFRTTLCLRVGCEALRLLADAGIPAVAFKGCAVVALLHPGSRGRMVKDVDVLIEADQVPAALTLLQAHGFKRTVGDGDLADYIAFVQNSPGAAGNQAISLTGRQSTALDLHWKLGRLDAAELLGTAWRVNFLGFEVPIVRPAFGLLLTVHHAIRNDFVPDDIARDVLDSCGWFRLLAADPAELACAREHADRWGLSDAVGAMSLIGQHFGHAGLLGNDRPTAAASDLADLYLRQLASAPINTDLAYLGSSRAARQVLSGALSGWRRYAGMMRAFEASNGEESRSLWQRIWRLALAAWALSPAEWRQVRALAHAKDRLVQ